MTVLLTGCAGFIGMHVARALLGRGEAVVGVDNLNDYYSVALKRDRLGQLAGHKSFAFHRIDIADRPALQAVLAANPGIDRIVHLAAQAGVRYSLTNPGAYIRANIEGQFAMLEAARSLSGLRHMVYASSSSVYGGNTKLPFAVEDRTDSPVSLYAATKKSGEVIAHSYADMFDLPLTGLRFFTVYGPWGRPDMSAFLFADAILKGEPIHVFNHGKMRRDFTYIDDIVAGVLGALDRPPPRVGAHTPQRLYNLGNNRSEDLMHFIALIERALGRKATVKFEPMQPGDVPETYADIAASQRDLGFLPTTSIDIGIPKFIAWFLQYHGK